MIQFTLLKIFIIFLSVSSSYPAFSSLTFLFEEEENGTATFSLPSNSISSSSTPLARAENQETVSAKNKVLIFSHRSNFIIKPYKTSDDPENSYRYPPHLITSIIQAIQWHACDKLTPELELIIKNLISFLPAEKSSSELSRATLLFSEQSKDSSPF